MAETRSRMVPALVYAALSTAIVSSLGMLLVPSISRKWGCRSAPRNGC